MTLPGTSKSAGDVAWHRQRRQVVGYGPANLQILLRILELMQLETALSVWGNAKFDEFDRGLSGFGRFTRIKSD